MTFEPADVFDIDDVETMEMLADPTRLEILELAMVPRSVSEIAEAMDVPRTRLYHHVKLLEDAGMLAVAETRPAGAMTEKIYQVAAYSFQPSDELMKTATPKDQAEAIMTSLLGTTRGDFIRAVAEERFPLSRSRNRKRVSLGRRLTTMTEEELNSFLTELEDLFEKYGDSEDEENAFPVAILHIVHPSSRKLP